VAEADGAEDAIRVAFQGREHEAEQSHVDVRSA
jgi:hypothetical protein